MVSNDTKGSVTSRRRPGASACKLGRMRDQRREQIRIEIADFALEDCGETFEARSGVNRGLRQGFEMRLETIALDVAQVADAVELHEH